MTSDPARRQPIRAQVVSKPKISTSAKVKMEGSGAERPLEAWLSGPGRRGPGCGVRGALGRAARPDRRMQSPAAAPELWTLRSVGHAHQPGRMGTALCGPVARAQQLLARSVWGGVRDPARWSGLDGLGAPGLYRGLHADGLRRRCLSGQRETETVGGWHRGARAAWTRVPGTVRGQLDNRSSLVRMAGGRGGREKPGFPGTSHLRGNCSLGVMFAGFDSLLREFVLL